MKALISTLILTAAVACVAQTHVVFNFVDLLANPATNRTLVIQQLQPIRGNLFEYPSGTNTSVTVSNMAVADYSCQIKAKGTSAPINFSITVTATNLGTVQATNIPSVVTQTYPESYKSAWTIAASDARYMSATNSAGTVSVYFATNSNPNTVVTAARPAVFYNSSGAVWVKTNSATNATGWDCILTNRP